MSDIQLYLDERQADIEEIAKTADNVIIGNDDSCRDVIDSRVVCNDLITKIDNQVYLHNQPLQAQIDAVNKESQKVKKAAQGIADTLKTAINDYITTSGAQRIKSSTETAYLRENADALDLIIDESKLPDKFFKRTPDKTAIKRYYKEFGKAPKGVEITATPKDPTLIFKAVK